MNPDTCRSSWATLSHQRYEKDDDVNDKGYGAKQRFNGAEERDSPDAAGADE